MAAKLRLGKGLDALLPLEEDHQTENPPKAGEEEGRVAYLPLESLKPNPAQPRKNFDEEKLLELADSIREHGIIDPLIVEEDGDGQYLIVGGERRYRAASMAGLTQVPAIVRNFSPQERMEVALIDNIQRSDLNPVEEARAYRSLMELTGLSQDDVAGRVGKSRSAVANTLRLLKLSASALDALEQNAISPGHGRALLSVEDPENRERLFQETVKEGLSVRETEKRAGVLNNLASGKGEPGKEKKAEKREPELVALEQKFIETLGTKVAIQGNFYRGSIKIDYYSMEDLDRLLEIMGRPES